MRLFPSSIREKVSWGYYACLGLIVVVALVNYFDLRRINRKIAMGMVISGLFEATLEMRRYEKNYFLFRVKEDYSENLRYTEMAEEILSKNEEGLSGLRVYPDVMALKGGIAEYKTLMKKFYGSAANTVESYVLEGRVRESGKRLVSTAERISETEKNQIQSTIKSSERMLFNSVVLMVVFGCIIGRYLSKAVVRPLKNLETDMRMIAEGRFDALNSSSTDKEIVSLNKAFTQMLRELELKQMGFVAQSEKLASLGTMISGVVHQINNPLSNISTSGEILKEELETAEPAYKRELVEQVIGEVARAKAITQALLDFTKKRTFRSQPLPLKELVMQTIGLLRGAIPTGVKVIEDVPEDLWIHADKQQIQQALLNVIKNAIDAIPDSGEVSVRAGEDKEAKTVSIAISDTGLGIEPENMEKIFDPFFTTKETGGTGLGLLVTKEILKEHGGTIEVQSRAGAGSTFTLKLPVKET